MSRKAFCIVFILSSIIVNAVPRIAFNGDYAKYGDWLPEHKDIFYRCLYASFLFIGLAVVSKPAKPSRAISMLSWVNVLLMTGKLIDEFCKVPTISHRSSVVLSICIIIGGCIGYCENLVEALVKYLLNWLNERGIMLWRFVYRFAVPLIFIISVTIASLLIYRLYC